MILRRIKYFFLYCAFCCCSCNGQTGGNAFHIVEEKSSVLSFLDSIHFSSAQNFILIDKSDYRLYLMKDTSVIASYPVVLGFNPVDDKLKQGDGCTPEGVFSIQSKYPHDSWSKFMWIDYPTADSWKKHNQAIKDGTIPANASIGGEIGIHGVPDGYDFMIGIKHNWTLGCISLKNEDVNALYDQVNAGTKVIIRK